MIPDGLKEKEFRAALRKEIRQRGSEAFSPTPSAAKLLPKIDGLELYSGPDVSITAMFRLAMDEAGLPFRNNWDISQHHARKVGAKRLDDTPIGELLTDMKLGEYFHKVYWPDRKKISNAVYQAWALASKKLIEQSEGHLHTSGCGGSYERVMCRVELSTASKCTRYTDINAASWNKYKNRKTPHSRFIYSCLTRLMLARKEVRDEYTQENVIDYYTQLGFYRMAQYNRLRRAKKRMRPFYQGSADEHIERIHMNAVRCAAVNLQPLQTAAEYERRTGFRPYSAVTNPQAMTL